MVVLRLNGSKIKSKQRIFFIGNNKKSNRKAFEAHYNYDDMARGRAQHNSINLSRNIYMEKRCVRKEWDVCRKKMGTCTFV